MKIATKDFIKYGLNKDEVVGFAFDNGVKQVICGSKKAMNILLDNNIEFIDITLDSNGLIIDVDFDAYL